MARVAILVLNEKQGVAIKDGGALRWLLGDRLSSTAYIVNGATEAGEVRYRAFGAGARWARFTSGTTPTTYRYTGQRAEAGLGLYYYGARWYDHEVGAKRHPALGRFVQADTIVPNPGDPQAYDRYAYANNNPLKYVDPSGHCGMLAELGESFTNPFGQTCLGMSGGLSRRAKAALSAGGGLTAAAALNAGLATGSPPSQADPLPPPLEAVAGQAAGASTTSFPLADGGPQTSIPASTGVYNNTLNVLTDPLPGVDPTAHIYLSNREREIVSLQRSIRSLESNVAEHQRKLEEYIQNPDAHDNQGRLRNASSEAVRQSIIRGRIAHLQSEIRAWQNRIQDLQRQLDEISKQ
jgi:RHS repeat-associated protein